MAFLRGVRISSVVPGYAHSRVIAYKLLARESFTAWDALENNILLQLPFLDV